MPKITSSFLFFCGILLAALPAAPQTGSDAPHVYVITSYGAVGDGHTINTKAIQKAVNDCLAHGGGNIDIPPGNFLTGTVQLYSNMELHFEPGAVLTGSTDNKEYGDQKDFGFSGLGAGHKTGILVAHDAENISITGPGTIRGNGNAFMYMDSLQYGMDFDRKYTRQKNEYMNPHYGRQDGPVLWKGSYEERPGVMVMFARCKNIRVNQLRFEESPNWTLAFLNSEDISVTGVLIRNNLLIPNSDGVDFYDCRNIILSGCNIYAGDDAIAVISSSHLTASDCILQSRSSGIRIGYNVYTQNNSGDLLFNNITILNSNRGIGIFQRQKGDMEHMLFSNISISTRLHSGQWWGHGEPVQISTVPGLGSAETGAIRHVHFSNLMASSESGIVLYASSKGLMEDISFDHLTLMMKSGPLTNAYGGNFDLRPTNDISKGIFAHAIPAVYARYVSGLALSDIRVYWEKTRPAFFTQVLQTEDVTELAIDGLHENAPPAATDRTPVVSLRRTGVVSVKEVSSTIKNKTTVRKEDRP